MSLEKTAAIIATIKDVTQGSDETIGTSLKSILSRMNNIKAGKFVDDNGEALNDVEKVLNKIGITMRDNNDQFLDSETIIDSVADKWDTLNKNTQKAVSTALGGTHQANSVIAMLDNYDKVKMLTETAYNSEGTAEKKFQDNYLNSLEAKTNALKASLENLSTSLVSDNMYSGFLDGAKAMADFAANTDILQASLAGLASAGGVYAFQQLINLFREFSNMGQAMDISRMTEISTDSFEQLLGLTQGLSESQTRMVLSSTALTEAQRAAVLVNQGMSEAEAQAAVAAMGLTTANEAAAASTFTLSADTITASLQALSPEIMVKAGVDPSAVDAYAAEEKQSSGKVTWDNETGAVDAFAAQVHRSSGLVSWGNETSRVKTHFTATGTVNWTNTTPPTKGAGGANGTAHARGTAHAAGSAQYNHLSGHAQASGNWATKTGGTTLVGELGREIVVNPATGTWNTVGDNGAEFVNIPAGSIVFNHLQTEALLDRGFINSRGLAQASGSAMVRGGIPVKQASIASKHTTYSGSKSPSNTDKAVAQAAKDSSSAAKSVTDAAEKVESWEDPWKNAVDWFERFTTKYNNSIDLNEAKAENYSSYENKNKYLDKEIADLSKLKGGYQQAQGYYKYQAEAYADMIGLSQDLRKKVQGGEINIDLLDEDTKSKVEAYQKWYDKIHECESELEKLKKKEKEVDQQKLDNITDRFDDLKKVYSTSSSVIESRLKYREENGESQAPGSKYYKDVNSQRKAQETQAALMEKEMVAYRAQMEKIRKKYGEGHELYKKALAGYNDLRDELYNCKQSAKELSNTMYELKEKAAEYKTAMYQGRSDNLSSFRDYKEATNYKGSKYGKLTVNDYAQAAKTNDQTILALQNQKKIAMAKLKTLSYGSPEYNDKLDEINGYTQKILDLGKANAELKKSAVEIRFKPFDDTIDSLDELIDDCDTLKDMLNSDTFFSDAGELTKQGAANIALINKGLNAEQQKIADYRAQLENVQQEYNAGNLTKEQLKEYQKQYKDRIKESSQAIYSYNQEMLKMYEDQVSKENDLLKENVDIRQKAKDDKEDYYQFDKTKKE